MTTDLIHRPSLRGIAVTSTADTTDSTLPPRLVRQRGVVESVTAEAITVRCDGGFAESYVLLAPVAGTEASDGFDLSPGDEVLVTSWLDDADPAPVEVD
jgi:hypothetical protein